MSVFALVSAGCIECNGDGFADIQLESVHLTREGAEAARLASPDVNASDSDVAVLEIPIAEKRGDES
ncbi:hypothetical protein [Marisediminicola sp. LYQ134]|uniref:hypothetical protein n=1 Tax=Marisediminicola sp. LYQ134 TaxID=3391061 RepID=UPI003983B120